MRTTGWILGIAASVLLGPVIYLLARLAESAMPVPGVPVAVPVTSRSRHR